MTDTPRDWPGLMDLQTASDYLSLAPGSLVAYLRRNGVEALDIGARLRRWRKRDLEELIARTPIVGSPPLPASWPAWARKRWRPSSGAPRPGPRLGGEGPFSEARRAIALARYTGAKRGDLIGMPRSARKDGRIRFQSGKRKIRVDVPEDPLLTAWLERTPDAAPLSARAGRKLPKGAEPPLPLTLVYNLSGRPYTENGLALELRKLLEAMHRKRRIDSEAYDLHGLRHTRGVELALAGCSDAEGAAMMGHGSPHSFSQDRRQADRTRLADAASQRLTAARQTP